MTFCFITNESVNHTLFIIMLDIIFSEWYNDLKSFVIHIFNMIEIKF